ncbi:S41 family peptidase [Candidatus Omnitrophota bacterium]
MKITVISLLLVTGLALSFGAGYAIGPRIFPVPAVPVQGLESIEQAWGIIFSDYVDKDRLDASKLSQAAIKGMAESLGDPYTSYFDAKTQQLNINKLEGKFNGIGAHVGIRDGQLTIIAPIAGSPADTAGIRAGDIIQEINGGSTSGMSVAEAVLNITGPRGTSVRLLILHQGDTESVELEIVRDEIKLPSVHFDMKEDIAYIRIAYFSERTDKELSLVLKDIASTAATGIILDMRSNPGGLLQSVVKVASHFLTEGIVTKVRDNKEEYTSIMLRPKGITTDLPILVLVDSYSASGSEVLAGALQDHTRAIIAGTRTYGKGSVNLLRQLKDGSGLYITTARWFTPNGHLIEGKGISPDVELELKDEKAIQWAIDYLKSKK